MQLSAPLSELLKISNYEKVFLFLDYDGTLADFAPNPDVVLPDTELISLLDLLNRQKNVELAVVSGRRLGHIRELVPINGLWLAGSYGIEMINPAGEEIDLLNYKELRPRVEKIKPYWQSLVDGRNDFYLEDKGWSIAIHANGKDRGEVNQVLEMAIKIEAPPGFILQGNDHFLELCPPEADKGKAVHFILRSRTENGLLPIFIGDDDKDESAFAEIQTLGGFGILVSKNPSSTNANYYLPNPDAVRIWLKEILVNEG